MVTNMLLLTNFVVSTDEFELNISHHCHLLRIKAQISDYSKLLELLESKS